MTDEIDIQEWLYEFLEAQEVAEVKRVETFEQAGVLTYDKGLVFERGGSVFYLTIQRK